MKTLLAGQSPARAATHRSTAYLKVNLINLLPIVSRWLHILPAITLVGGAIFMRFAYLPGLRAVDSGPMDQLREAVRRRWARLVMASVALLLISGLYNAALRIRTERRIRTGII